MGLPRRKDPTESVRSIRRTDQPGPRFNYELFNGNNFNIRYWSWNYRGCWPHYTGRVVLGDLCMTGASVPDTLSSGDGTSLKPSLGQPDTFARSTQARSALLGISVERAAR